MYLIKISSSWYLSLLPYKMAFPGAYVWAFIWFLLCYRHITVMVLLLIRVVCFNFVVCCWLVIWCPVLPFIDGWFSIWASCSLPWEGPGKKKLVLASVQLPACRKRKWVPCILQTCPMLLGSLSDPWVPMLYRHPRVFVWIYLYWNLGTMKRLIFYIYCGWITRNEGIICWCLSLLEVFAVSRIS
jgi:hypothetical protein